jgi:hypothetical protein
MVQELISSIKEPGNPTTYTNTPKFVEKVVVEVMKIDKAVEFDGQTMAIMSLNMGNLTLEVSTLKNRLVRGEKVKLMLQEEFDKERDFKKGYKHNVEIWRKNNVEVE